MRRSIAIALVVVASACSSKKEPPAKAEGSGSAVGSAAGSGSATGSGSAAPCDDADIQKHIDDSLAVSLAYLNALEKKVATWKQDCEAAKQDLLALEPDALKFMEAMLSFRGWGQSLSDTCRQRVGELGEKAPATLEIEKRTPDLEAKVKPMLERCEKHPGFQDAAAKGLRVMRRKKQ